MSIGLFRVMASLGRNLIVSNTFGSFAMLVVMALGGFVLSRGQTFCYLLKESSKTTVLNTNYEDKMSCFS